MRKKRQAEFLYWKSRKNTPEEKAKRRENKQKFNEQLRKSEKTLFNGYKSGEHADKRGKEADLRIFELSKTAIAKRRRESKKRKLLTDVNNTSIVFIRSVCTRTRRGCSKNVWGRLGGGF